MTHNAGEISWCSVWFLLALATILARSMSGKMIDSDGWVVDADLGIISPLGEIIDKSLRQTAEADLKYAVIPEPWLMDWVVWRKPLFPNDARRRKREGLFWWRVTCGFRAMLLEKHEPGGVRYFSDGDGNFVLCLQRRRHDGPCGGSFLRPVPPPPGESGQLI